MQQLVRTYESSANVLSAKQVTFPPPSSPSKITIIPSKLGTTSPEATSPLYSPIASPATSPLYNPIAPPAAPSADTQGLVTLVEYDGTDPFKEFIDDALDALDNDLDNATLVNSKGKPVSPELLPMSMSERKGRHGKAGKRRKQTLGSDLYSDDDLDLDAIRGFKSAPLPARNLSIRSECSADEFQKKITVRKFKSIMSRAGKSYDIDSIADDLESDEHPGMIDLRSIPKYTKRVQTLDAKHWKKSMDETSD